MKAVLTVFLILVAGFLSACGSSGGCTVVPGSSISGTAQGPHCADQTSATTAAGYSISGGVSGGKPLGVSISLTGATTGSTNTEVNGNFNITSVPNGIYTLRASLAGYIFSPASIALTVSGANLSGNNFSQTGYIGATSGIFGLVGGAAAQNVMLTLSGANTGSVLTDASGNYGFTGLAAGSYTLTPSLAGYIFSPVSSVVTTTGGGNFSASTFTASVYAAATSSLSGTVSGAVAQNVTITLGGSNSGSALTDANGNFSFSGLAAGSYLVTPVLAGRSFSPASSTVTTLAGGNGSAGNFAAAP